MSMVKLQLFNVYVKERVEKKGRKMVSVQVEEEVKFHQWFEKKSIGTVGEYLKDGVVVPMKSVIFDVDSRMFYNVNKPVKSILKIKSEKRDTTPIGFLRHTKRYQ